MEENNKYYTPDISDLFIGYECEFRFRDTDNWVKEIISVNTDLLYLQDVMKERIGKQGGVRTKCLDKEDIKNENWEFKPKGLCNWFEKLMPEGYFLDIEANKEDKKYLEINYCWEYWYKKDSFWLGYYGTNIAIIQNTSGDLKDNQIKYSGKCLSINELKKIMKYLNIPTNG